MREQEDTIQLLRELLQSQTLASLSTGSGDGAYASLIAIVPAPDCRSLLFATTRATRKFAHLQTDSRVALLVDNRRNRLEDFTDASAVTLIGVARELEAAERPPAETVYLERFPHLALFVRSPGSALFQVEIDRCLLVTRFQHVTELHLR